MIVEVQVLTPKRTEYGKAIRKQYDNHEIKEKRSNMVEYQPRTDGISNTLTTVLKDNMVLETSEIINPLKDTEGVSWQFAQNVYSEETPCIRTVKAGGGSGNIPKVIETKEVEIFESNVKGTVLVQKGDKYFRIRIRKLTPKECGRLMGVSDEDIDKMANVNSNTQLYKGFGNSIVVDCMEAMFKNLNIKNVERFD